MASKHSADRRDTIPAVPLSFRAADQEEDAERQIVRLRSELECHREVNRCLAREIEMHRTAMAVLGRLSAVLAQPGDRDAALEVVVRDIVDLSGSSGGALWVCWRSGGPRLAYSCDVARETLALIDPEAILETPVQRSPVDLSSAPGGRTALERLGAGSAVMIPLIGPGERVGYLMLTFVEERPVDEARIDLARMLGMHVGLAVTGFEASTSLSRTLLQYRALFDAAQDAITLLTPDGVIVDANLACAQTTLVPNEQMIGRHLREFAAPGQAEENAERYQASLSRRNGDGPPVYPVQRADGKILYMQWAKSPVEVDGQPLVFAIGRDVTSSVEASKKLQASEENYRSLIERIPDVVWRARLPGWSIEFIAGNVEQITGCSAEELMEDGHDLWLGRIHPDDRAQVDAACAALADENQPFDVQYRVQRTDGTWIWVHDRATLAYMRDGAAYVDGLMTNITERRELEEQLLQNQKMEAVGQLTGGVAHDFNNILAVILANSDFLAESFAASDPRREDVQDIRAAAVRGAGLTRQLLAFSRRQVLEPTALELNSVVENLEKMLRRIIGEDVELVTALSPQLGSVFADRGQIEQVIMNMVVNARDAMPRGGRLLIETLNAEDAPFVVLAIRDTGTGMDDRTMKRIFEPFYTTKEKNKGTGLGLSTCYGIVRQSRGHIEVESAPGSGTTFRIFLPRTDHAPAAASRHIAPTVLDGNETILLVEDEDLVRAAVSRILKSYGYRVLGAANAAEALALARNETGIDLVLSDMVLPGTGGPELAREIMLWVKDAKLLFMSGYTDDAILRAGVRDPGTHFIQKPFSHDALAQKVREVLAS